MARLASTVETPLLRTHCAKSRNTLYAIGCGCNIYSGYIREGIQPGTDAKLLKAIVFAKLDQVIQALGVGPSTPKNTSDGRPLRTSYSAWAFFFRPVRGWVLSSASRLRVASVAPIGTEAVACRGTPPDLT